MPDGRPDLWADPGRQARTIGNGMLSIYLDPAHFGAEHFAAVAREYALYVKASRPASPGGEVLVPGEPEARMRAQRLRDGVPLQVATWGAIKETAAGLGLVPPTV